jgi:hypothetical protein
MNFAAVLKFFALVALGVITIIFGVAGACGGIVATTSLAESWNDPGGLGIALLAALVCVIGLGVAWVCMNAMKTIREGKEETSTKDLDEGRRE